MVGSPDRHLIGFLPEEGRVELGHPVKGWKQRVEEEIGRCHFPDGLLGDPFQWQLGVAERSSALR